jgi:hypothetical protein
MIATVIVFTVGVSGAWAEEIEFKKNPNNLTICPQVDVTKYSDRAKLEKWDNCWGSYTFIDNTIINKDDLYEGEWHKGVPHGTGLHYVSKNNARYIGEFKFNNRHGSGQIISVDGDKYIGIFKYNQLISGRAIYIDGGFYEGEFKNGLFEGIGFYKSARGSKYFGQFKNGNMEGQGVADYVDGKRHEGLFSNDKFIRYIALTIPKIKKYKEENIDKSEYEYNEFKIKSKSDEIKSINVNQLKICPKLDTTKAEVKEQTAKWNNCWGYMKYGVSVNWLYEYQGEWRYGGFNGNGILISTTNNGTSKYIGELKDGIRDGFGSLNLEDGSKYVGEFKGNRYDGKGILSKADGTTIEGIWQKDKLIRSEKVNFQVSKAINDKVENIEQERQQLTEERRKFEQEKRNREQARNSQRINLQVTNTQPNNDGDFVISIQTGADTASLKINGEEQGGRVDGNYLIKRVARAGSNTDITVTAKDVYGNIETKTIAVTRQVTASSQIKYAELNPALVKTQTNKDAVAIIIGIADYKNLPRADYANDDARVFYDYAIRGLGIKSENIKLLVDADAGQGEILKTFKTWLPARVRATTDVYVYYSGHGLPSADGQTLYLLPQQADRDLIEDTAVAQSRINAAIQATKPKSVTIFLDSCYSGAARSGQSLIASARPISLKANTQTFPADFTVFTASTAEQISSSSNELKHGIFSYYLMRGMEGDADANKDGKITTGEMHAYLTENVARQASLANRVQQPQLTGDANRVLVGK